MPGVKAMEGQAQKHVEGGSMRKKQKMSVERGVKLEEPPKSGPILQAAPWHLQQPQKVQLRGSYKDHQAQDLAHVPNAERAASSQP